MGLKLSVLLLLAVVLPAASVDYVGPSVCAQCHRDLAKAQQQSNMARTWLGTTPSALAPSFQETQIEGPQPTIEYRLERTSKGFTWKVHPAGAPEALFPVETILGGSRHGLSFLVRATGIDGLTLPRAPLIETRYLHHEPDARLTLSPGFPAEKPQSWETRIGRVLSPQFERKCLACHGLPANGVAGVHCETCHGPGRPHLEAVAKGNPRSGIVNPARLTADQAMERCAVCHSGFSELSDALPDDLLISNQANALKNSECFIQSGGKLGCTSCHDPHRDGGVQERSVALCQSCHKSSGERHAAVCPINAQNGCIGCHMPGIAKGPFTMSDHWIRVHTEQGIAAPAEVVRIASSIPPRREFLRILVLEDPAKAAESRAHLGKGESFFDIASRDSADPSAPGGGFLGETWIAQMDPRLAAAAVRLAHGENSAVIESGGKYIILGRLPRDFRERAGRLAEEGSTFRSQGHFEQASAKYQEALQVYPYLLRALIFLGATLAEQGNPGRGAGVLEFAARLYPRDPAAQYNLALAYGAQGRAADEVRAYQRALELEPDLVVAYQNLGAALLANRKIDEAIGTFRRGLDINPLSGVLYYNLSVALEQHGGHEEAARNLALASRIDPEFVKKQEQAR
jgi:predicted CXXCH cytochrome family protein